MSLRCAVALLSLAEATAAAVLPKPQRLLAPRVADRQASVSLLEEDPAAPCECPPPKECPSKPACTSAAESPGSKKAVTALNLPLKVAMMCPTLDPLIRANAQDAESGWNMWLQLTDNSARLEGSDEKPGMRIHVKSTSVPFSKATFMKTAKSVGAGDYDLVVGCSTHHFKEVASAMQAMKIPNIQCNAGNPKIWEGLANVAKADKEPFYGFGLHSPFTAYPMPYLRMVKEAFSSRGVQDVTVGLVIGRETDFTKGLCDAATKAAESLNVKIYQNRAHRVEDIRTIAPSIDALYACTMLPDGQRVMDELKMMGAAKRPAAISVSVAPSKPNFVKIFGETALGVSYPGQWHHTARFKCDSGDCPAVLNSTEDYVAAYTAMGNAGKPSYDRASCSAAGSALEAALASLPADFQKLQRKERREKLREALQQVDTNSFFGRIRFHPVTHMNVGRDPVISQYQKSGGDVADVVVSGGPGGPALQLGVSARKGTPRNSSEISRPARAGAAGAKCFGAFVAVSLAFRTL